MGRSGWRWLLGLSWLLLVSGCAELDRAIKDFDGKLQAELARTREVMTKRDGSSGEQDPASAGAEPAAASAASAASAGPAPSGPAGSCAASCDHYLACKGIRDRAQRPACVVQCEQLLRSPQELGQFEAMPCPQAIAAVEGTRAAPAAGTPAPAPGGSRGCPPPMPAKRTPEDEKVFQLATTRVLCGWVYNQSTGSSKEMRLRFLADGTMIHQYKTERSGNTTDGWGNVTGSFGVATASGDTYCWKFAQPEFLYSKDGASFTPFVTKVEDNGNGVIFFQTRLGEFKVCN